MLIIRRNSAQRGVCKKDMKIAFLNIYGGRISRGAETAVHEIAKRLGHIHDVSVLQSGLAKNTSYTTYSINHIPTITTDVSNHLILRILKKVYLDPYSLLVLYFSLRSLPILLKKKYALLIPVNGFWQIIICKIIGFMRGSKVVVPGYAGIGTDDFINLKLAPSAFFAMTNMAAKWAKTINNRIPIKVLPGGVDTALFNCDVLPMKLPLKPPIVLTVAALQPYKRVDLVIKAAAKLPNVSLVVAGNGILKKEIEKLGSKLMPGRFLRLDIDYNNLPSLYTACDVFTLPSVHPNNSLFYKLTGIKPQEAFGIVYLEAMSCGLPVVAPDDQLRREIIGNAGIFVDCTDINLYAHALKKAMFSKWDNILAKQAEKFSWEKIVANFSRDLESI